VGLSGFPAVPHAARRLPELWSGGRGGSLGDGKHQLTRAAEAFHTSWDQECDAVEYVVGWGLEHRTLEKIRAIGVDEIQYAKGHKYLTLVYQIDQGLTRLLWIGKERTIESFQGFFTVIGEPLAAQIEFVCSDMCQPYLDVIRQKCSQALHILDRFHIVAKMNQALDDVRAAESRKMAQDGTHLANYLSRSLPMNSSDESFCMGMEIAALSRNS